MGDFDWKNDTISSRVVLKLKPGAKLKLTMPERHQNNGVKATDLVGFIVLLLLILGLLGIVFVFFNFDTLVNNMTNRFLP